MAYESRHLHRQKVRYNSSNDDNPLAYQLVVGGAKVTPTSATIAIYAPGVSTARVSATAMTKSGSLLTYSLDTTTTASYPIGEGYRGEIVVTYNSLTYDRVIFFDVVKFLLDLSIGRDQLVAMDDELNAAEHAGDGDFSELIQACRDDIQLLIESHVIENGKLVENMILDHSRIAIPARHYILSQFWRNKGNDTKAEMYEARFNGLFRAALGSIRYDTSQSGDEGSGVGGLESVKLVT